MSQKVYIKEIFRSIQGEGEYVGYEQIFIRFIGCNIKCNYCDTDINRCEELKLYRNWGSQEYETIKNPVSVEELIKIIKDIDPKNNVHSISLTGGEPLININFLKEFLSKLKKTCDTRIFLETNGTLYEELHCINEYVDIVSMDLKLASYLKDKKILIKDHEMFLKQCMENDISTYIKVVVDNNFKENELMNYLALVKPYKEKIKVYIQPMMENDKMLISSEKLSSVFELCNSMGLTARVIPQIHKMLVLI